MIRQISLFLLLFVVMPPKSKINLSLIILIISIVGGVPFYIDENSSSNTPDGSPENPFKSLSQAYETIGPTSAELILQGSSISLDSALSFTSGTNYTIRLSRILSFLTTFRPNDSFPSDYFQIYLRKGTKIHLDLAILSISRVEFIEEDQSRLSAEHVFQLSKSTLILNVIINNFSNLIVC